MQLLIFFRILEEDSDLSFASPIILVPLLVGVTSLATLIFLITCIIASTRLRKRRAESRSSDPKAFLKNNHWEVKHEKDEPSLCKYYWTCLWCSEKQNQDLPSKNTAIQDTLIAQRARNKVILAPLNPGYLPSVETVDFSEKVTRNFILHQGRNARNAW